MWPLSIREAPPAGGYGRPFRWLCQNAHSSSSLYGTHYIRLRCQLTKLAHSELGCPETDVIILITFTVIIETRSNEELGLRTDACKS